MAEYAQLFSKLSTALSEAAELAAALGRGLPPHAVATTTPATAAPAGKARAKPGPKPGANKKEKKERDPDAPKRPMTAFLLYSRDRRASFVKENPSVTGRAITTGIADEWRSLDAAKKAPYESEYHKKMDGWRDAKAHYDHPEGEAGPSSAPKETAAAVFVAPGLTVDRAAAAADDEERRRKKEEKKKRKEQKHASEEGGSSSKKKKKGHRDE